MTDKDIYQKLDDIHSELATISARWNGGPGTWTVCDKHKEEIARLYKKVGWMQRIVYMAIGGGSVALFITLHLERILKFL